MVIERSLYHAYEDIARSIQWLCRRCPQSRCHKLGNVTNNKLHGAEIVQHSCHGAEEYGYWKYLSQKIKIHFFLNI